MNALDGSGLITAISAAIALIAYLRNFPVKELQTKLEEAFDPKKGKGQQDFLRDQKDRADWLILYLRTQFALMGLVAIMALRIVVSVYYSYNLVPLYEASKAATAKGVLDSLIGGCILLASLIFLYVHGRFDWGRDIPRAKQKKRDIERQLREGVPTGAPPPPAASPTREITLVVPTDLSRIYEEMSTGDYLLLKEIVEETSKTASSDYWSVRALTIDSLLRKNLIVRLPGETIRYQATELGRDIYAFARYT